MSPERRAARLGEARPVALVTGACSGIGLALATGLARRGHDLVLVSNRPEPLSRTAAELERSAGVSTLVLPLDLARLDAAQQLADEVRARTLPLEVLVHNAGIFFFGEVADTDPARAAALLGLHVVTPSLLSTLLAPQLRAQRRGRILFTSSISAVRDLPGLAYYGTSKRYLRGFASALRSELSVYGVTVTCLLPGATATALYDGTSVPARLATRLGVMMSPTAVAEEGLDALFAGRAECIPGLLSPLLAAGARLVPQRAVDLARRHAPWLPRR
jgi:short-subunit dehydrogenase